MGLRPGNKERGRISPAIENFPSADLPSLDLDVSDDGVGNGEQNKLKSSSPLGEIIEAIMHTVTKGGFFLQHGSLPSYTFTSADAVQWLIQHVDGVNDGDEAILIMEKMLSERRICHASGDFRHPFIVGFYLYHICVSEKDAKEPDYCPPIGDLQIFENEWIEVEVRHPNNWKRQFEEKTPNAVPQFFSDRLEDKCQDDQQPTREWKIPMYKQAHLDIDVNNKSDRTEWGHCKYHSFYRPDSAFELVVQWTAASGTIVADLISGWARKSQTCGIQMIPIPGDPLSLPFNDKSDPLRGPVFVPLDTECLMGKRSYLFEGFVESTWESRLVLLQEAIVQRFGFIPCVVDSRKSNSSSHESSHHHHHQYVHVTGNVFILIPSTPCSRLEVKINKETENKSRASTLQSPKRYPVYCDVVSSPHEEYITRLVNGNTRNYNGLETRPGFLWFWNHMVSRRWKSSSTPATGDEAFQNKILKDFREFCSNRDNRLKSFWDSCCELLSKSLET